jgi:hypothetical protein
MELALYSASEGRQGGTRGALASGGTLLLPKPGFFHLDVSRQEFTVLTPCCALSRLAAMRGNALGLFGLDAPHATAGHRSFQNPHRLITFWFVRFTRTLPRGLLPARVACCRWTRAFYTGLVDWRPGWPCNRPTGDLPTATRQRAAPRQVVLFRAVLSIASTCFFMNAFANS